MSIVVSQVISFQWLYFSIHDSDLFISLAQIEIFYSGLRCSYHRVFAATWNVAGKTPDRGLNLNDFLPSDDYSDIYVLGYAHI